MPVLKSFFYLIIQILILIISVLGISIGKNKVRNAVDMYQWRPVGTLDAGIIHIGEGTVLDVILFQSLCDVRILRKILSYFFALMLQTHFLARCVGPGVS